MVHILSHFDFATLNFFIAIQVCLEQILLEKNFHCMISLQLHPLVSWLTLSVALAKLKDPVLEFGVDVPIIVFFHRISLISLDQALESHFL